MTQHKRNGAVALRARQERALAACVERVEKYGRSIEAGDIVTHLGVDLEVAIAENRRVITDLSNKGIWP